MVRHRSRSIATHLQVVEANTGQDVPMAVEFVVDPELDGDLRARIVALWVEVTNAGGAVGFVAPVTADEVRPTAEAAFAGVAAGLDRLVAGMDDGELVALLFVTDNRFGLKD